MNTRRIGLRALALLALAVVAGCYHVTVISGAPAAATTIDKPWQHSFIYGLVPPVELTSTDACSQGVAKVETERSFVNGLAYYLVGGLYSPIHVTITCASGPVAR